MSILPRILARKLDALYLASGASRYERATNAYQADLLDAYDQWTRGLMRRLKGVTDLEQARQIVTEAMPELRRALQDLAQSTLPAAVGAMTDAYVPSADAWRMIADAITETNSNIDTRLVPDVEEKLLRGIAEGADLNGVAQSLVARVGIYAGDYWAVIQRLIGDYAAQAQTGDDVIYKCRWVRVHDDHSCEACIAYEGEYDSYTAMLEITRQSVPGYFFNSPLRSGWGNCRCYLELFIDGKWRKV